MVRRCLVVKKEEANDILQHLMPNLEQVGIQIANCKVDSTTELSGRQRGDVWVSRVPQSHKAFEVEIIGLLEAKHRNCEIGDMDWRDAMGKGRAKAEKQGLNFYAVTNCTDTHRYYNRFTDDEVILDGAVATKLQPPDVLEKLQAQLSPDNSRVFHKTTPIASPVSETKFRKSLERLADIYRSCGLKKGDERIDPTVAFVVLKYIGEKEQTQRTLSQLVKIWPEFGANGNYRADFEQAQKDTFRPDYGNTYGDFQELVRFPSKLGNDHYKQIYPELDSYHFHGCAFDVFGAIYEEFASQTKKKEFGEFYTRRHITGVVARLLLRKEVVPRNIRICDPACGTGGFLTEAYKALLENYETNGKLNADVRTELQQSTFWGLDNDEQSIARTKLNMFLVGDGHTNISHVKDSLVAWQPSLGWDKDVFDYILTNPPMGRYSGEAKVEDFSFTNEKRSEMLFAEKVIDATKPGQDIAIILPDGALEAPSREGFRIKLLGRCDIHAMVSLTRFAFAPYTKEKTYILFLRRKQAESVGQRQSFPIWHFIVDYDGFANSDKRFKTKYHDDLPELESKFPGAMDLARRYVQERAYFNANYHDFEREVNHRERSEGLTGLKCGFVPIEQVGPDNFHNLLSEFYLRPVTVSPITTAEFDSRGIDLLREVESALREFEGLRKVFDED